MYTQGGGIWTGYRFDVAYVYYVYTQGGGIWTGYRFYAFYVYYVYSGVGFRPFTCILGWLRYS